MCSLWRKTWTSKKKSMSLLAKKDILNIVSEDTKIDIHFYPLLDSISLVGEEVYELFEYLNNHLHNIRPLKLTIPEKLKKNIVKSRGVTFSVKDYHSLDIGKTLSLKFQNQKSWSLDILTLNEKDAFKLWQIIAFKLWQLGKLNNKITIQR